MICFLTNGFHYCFDYKKRYNKTYRNGIVSVKETIYSGYTHSSFTQLVVVGLTNDSRNATVFK